jgi:hypothetical protein
MKKPLGSFRGQIAVLYAGMIVGLLGATALATDIAVMYLNWQHVQKGVDAAATAGANYLTGLAFTGTAAAGCGSESDDAEKAACTYAANNGSAREEPVSIRKQQTARRMGILLESRSVLIDAVRPSLAVIWQRSGRIHMESGL